jgi:elongation factor 1-beta
MAKVVVTLKIMPENPEVNLVELESTVKKIISEFAGEGETKTEKEPVAFGLTNLKIIFVMEESLGSPDPVEEKISALENVASVETTDVRRAIG